MNLLGLDINELTSVAQSVGLPKFTGKQMADWMYRKGELDIERWTNIPKAGRQALQAQYGVTGVGEPLAQIESKDGTRKYLFRTEGGQTVEAVYIPDEDRRTLCVSTQAGCQMGCRFCMTGTQVRYAGNLTAADILGQVRYFGDLTNIVLMGEGEPMNNIDEVLRALRAITADWGMAWSPKRVTVSTVGVIPGLKRYLDESECHLAISLHNPIASERAEAMPAEKAYPIREVMDLVRQYDWTHQRRVSLEYICWGGQNDDRRHADALIELLRGIECRINLIRYHEGADNNYPASDERQMEQMRDYLNQHGITTTIRRSRGEDILAACGMLANQLQQ